MSNGKYPVKRRVGVAILVLMAGLGGVSGFVAPGRAAEQSTVVSAPVSPLEGAANFRDIGGYATADGRRVRRGLVYRSNRLSELTAKDYEYLNGLGIRLVCDFRTDDERGRAPTRWQGTSPEMMRAQILQEADLARLRERSREAPTRSSAERLIETYERMVTKAGAEEYGRLYRRIAAGVVPMIAHCTAGKDRTGLFSAILLTMLGVPRSGVMQDYMLTGDYMLAPRALAQAIADQQRSSSGATQPSEASVRATYTMHAEVLTSTFATIDRSYGSFDDFVRDGLKLTADDVATLRSRLLE